MLTTAVVGHATYREGGIHKGHDSALETIGRTVRWLQQRVREDKWCTGPNGPGYKDPAIMHVGPALSQALEDVLPTWKREQLANGVDHDKNRYFLPLPIRRFPPAVAKSATVSAVEAFP
eukprot:281949-Lingulodinium_polyedra.AAC.1